MGNYENQNLKTRTIPSSSRLQEETSQDLQPPPSDGFVTPEATELNERTLRTNRGRGRGRGQFRGLNRDRKKPHEIYLEKQKILEEMFTNKYYKKFFTIKAETAADLAAIDVIKANKQLEAVLGGEPKSVTELRDGSLLVEVRNEEQSVRIRNVKNLDNLVIEVKDHQKLNQIKGTIRYKNLPNYTEQQLLDELQTQKVAEIYRIKKKIGGGLQDTHIYIITFDACNLPQDIRIGWTRCPVREYIPRPRRCYKCQAFGHGSKTCRSVEDICVTCGLTSHGIPCENDPKCSNCSESHPASSRDCFYYNLEQDTITLQTREKMSYAEAKRKSMDKFLSPGKSYAGAVTQQLPKPRTSANTRRQVNPLTSPPRISVPLNHAETDVVGTSYREVDSSQISQQSTSRSTLSEKTETRTTPTRKEHKEQFKHATHKQESVSNVITTIVGNRNVADSGHKLNERKRDGSVLGETEPVDRVSKRSNSAASHKEMASGSSPSPILPPFPSPSPVLASRTVNENRSRSRDRTKSSTSTGFHRRKEKDEDLDDPMNY